MTLRLILMRHAKSDWDHPFTQDFDRPLNERGRESATAIGKWLDANSYIPDLVLCSAAARTRETLELVSSGLSHSADVEFLDTLYLASPETMFQTLCARGRSSCVLMLAHNPGSAILASMLVEKSPNHPRFDDYPTAATTVMDFDASDWASLRSGTGRIVGFVVPRDLKG